jgi:hypothetical protein
MAWYEWLTWNKFNHALMARLWLFMRRKISIILAFYGRRNSLFHSILWVEMEMFFRNVKAIFYEIFIRSSARGILVTGQVIGEIQCDTICQRPLPSTRTGRRTSFRNHKIDARPPEFWLSSSSISSFISHVVITFSFVNMSVHRWDRFSHSGDVARACSRLGLPLCESVESLAVELTYNDLQISCSGNLDFRPVVDRLN